MFAQFQMDRNLAVGHPFRNLTHHRFFALRKQINSTSVLPAHRHRQAERFKNITELLAICPHLSLMDGGFASI